MILAISFSLHDTTGLLIKPRLIIQLVTSAAVPLRFTVTTNSLITWVLYKVDLLRQVLRYARSHFSFYNTIEL